MNTEDIKITVLNTMAEAADSSAERYRLLTKVESARFEESVRFERQKQVLLRIIIYVLFGIFICNVLQPWTFSQAVSRFEHHVNSTATEKPWWVIPSTRPSKAPTERRSP